MMACTCVDSFQTVYNDKEIDRMSKKSGTNENTLSKIFKIMIQRLSIRIDM